MHQIEVNYLWAHTTYMVGLRTAKSKILFPSFQAGFSNPQHKPHTDAERSVGRQGQIILRTP